MNFDFLVSLFFPRTCVACRAFVRTGALCARCGATIMLSKTLFCGQCDAPFAPRSGAGGALRSPCHPAFPYLRGTAGNYEAPALRALVHGLKFRGIRAAAEPLAALLAAYAAPFVRHIENAAVVPIPLSHARLRQRGFNQSELIAERFAGHFGLPITTACLSRARHAKPQSETRTVAERKENIRGCFAMQDPASVRGKNIILIDDVTTSGATFFEAARTLKNGGAGNILALAAAKTHRDTISLWHRSP